MTEVNIELLMDYDMYLFVENGIRGEISQCSHRYSKANNKYMVNFNPDLESKYILHLDANNLYGWSMSELIPLKNYKWVNPDDIDFPAAPDDSPLG